MSLARRALAEPLVQFALVGILFFGADRMRRPTVTGVRVGGSEGSIARHLVVDDATKERVRSAFERAEGRAPSSSELERAVSMWVDEEILFREALSRKLDRGDDRVRQLLAGKMRFVLESESVVPEPSEADVRGYYQAHADRWSKDEAFDFVHVFVRGDDAAAEARAKALLEQLEQGEEPGRLGDVFSGGRRYRRRSLSDLAESFGESFSNGLEAQAPGKWHLRRSRFGLHLVRVEGRSPAEAPPFEAVREDAKRQLVEEKKASAVAQRVAELRARWDVVGAR